MNPFGIVDRIFRLRPYALIVLTLVVAISVSGTVFYFITHQAPADDYARRLSGLSLYRAAVVRNSLYIYLSFAAVAFVAVVLFGTYYSHKVAGPLYRLRMFAKQASAGDFERKLRFRDGDAIHELADAGNHLLKSYSERVSAMKVLVEDMQRDASELKKHIDGGNQEQMNAAIERITAARRRMKRILAEVRL